MIFPYLHIPCHGGILPHEVGPHIILDLLVKVLSQSLPQGGVPGHVLYELVVLPQGRDVPQVVRGHHHGQSVQIAQGDSREGHLIGVDDLHVNIGAVLEIVEGALAHLGDEHSDSTHHARKPQQSEGIKRGIIYGGATTA